MAHQASSVGVFTLDANLEVRSWDAWLAAATGIAEAHATGRPIVELFPEIAERGIVDRLRRVVENGTVEVLAPAFHHYLIPCAPRQPGGRFTRMQQHVTISPLRAGDGVVGAVVTVEDVTLRLEREKELAAQLRSADEAVRLRAARSLAERAADPLLLSPALGDASWRVRQAAAGGFAAAESGAAADVLLAAVRDRHRDPGLLSAALGALAATRQDVLPALVDLLRSEAAEVRTYAALAIGQTGDERGSAALLRALGDADSNVRYHAIEALGRLGAAQAVPQLLDIAASGDFYLAFAALEALAAIADPAAAPRLEPLLDDELLQTAAAAALAQTGDETSVPALAAHLVPGADIGALARALMQIHQRMETDYGAGALVADGARTAIQPDGAQALAAALPVTPDEAIEALVVVLGWLTFDGIESVLAPMLGHPLTRRAAARALASRGAAAVPLLVELLEADDGETIKAAARTLGEIGRVEAVPSLCARLDGPAEIAIAAAGALAAIGDRRAFDSLLRHLDNPDPAVRQAVISAIHSLGHPRTRDVVAKLLRDPSPLLREAAVKIAGYFGYPEFVANASAFCTDPDERVRRAAVEHVAFYDDAAAADALRRVLDDDSPRLRAAAAGALAHVRSGAAVPILRRAFADSDLWVRYHAARAAAAHAHTEIVEALIHLAGRDPMPPVRIAAIEALREVNDAAAAAVLRTAARDAVPEVRAAALEALGGMRCDDARTELLGALDDADPAIRAAALRGLARRRDAGTVQRIHDVALQSAEAEVAAAALAALGAIDDAAAVEALVSASASRRLARVAVAALADARPEHVHALEQGLAHADAHVRRNVVHALSRRRDGTAEPLLARALEDDAAIVRLAAARALGRLDLRSMEGRLEGVARSDEDEAVRDAAHSALLR